MGQDRMGNRLYVSAVFLFWLATMGWLLSQRILPQFMYGDPPKSGVAYFMDPVAWDIEVDGVSCGSATMLTVEGSSPGLREAHSLVELHRLPIPKGLPSYFASMIPSIDALSPKIRSRVTFDSSGRMLGFDTWVFTSPEDSTLRLTGFVVSGQLKLKIRAGHVYKQLAYDWPVEGSLTSELAPETSLMLLYPGKKWRNEVYNPFSTNQEPFEVLEAHVVEEVAHTYNGERCDAHRVEFRTASEAGQSEKERLRSTLWVAKDGRVLRHETKLLGSMLTLNRLGIDESNSLVSEKLDLERYSIAPEPSRTESIGPASDEP